MENARITFNMESTGARIAELRRAADMTQMDLADRMGISFQAVSNWERGLSMPDIAKLPELAELFHVTVDDLLGQRSEVVSHALAGTMDTLLSEHPDAIGELAGAAPLLPPSDVDKAVDTPRRLPIRQIADLLPFLSQKACEDYALWAEEQKDPDLSMLLPFIRKELVDTMAERAENEAEYGMFLPFISNEALMRKAEKHLSDHDVRALEPLAPFLPKEFLQKAALQLGRKEGFHAIAQLAPFLGEDFFDRLLRE